MAKKTQKNEGSMVEVGSEQGRGEAGVTPVSDDGLTGADVSSDDSDREDYMLFQLYVARVSTIDLYRVPITGRGLPAAFRNALSEAKVALEVFTNTNERQ